ncbi:MAG TPA: RimK family alpha-L-glutamate ligase [Pirellulales bacterium]|nr:RimK family alpha-L-glutamate ligase [Pirellulales bacterium]
MLLAVLGSPDSWYFKDLYRAAAGRHELVSVTFCDLASALGETAVSVTSGDCRLLDVDAVLVRTMPPGSLEQVVFRMDALARLEAAGKTVLNPPKAVEIAVDKYLTSARLASAGLRIPRTIVCQTADAAMAAFAELGGDVVLKPLFGAEGRGITRLVDDALALRAFKMLEQLGAVLYLQEFIDHEGADLRLLVIGERVLGMRRSNPLDWRTNVSRGAQAEPFTPNAELIELAHRAAAAVGAPLAGVDLLPGRDGRLYAIEVNAVPGWKALSRALEVDVAKLVLEYLEAGNNSGFRQA